MNSQNKIKLWHCHNARSLRPLWALEEMGIDYHLEVLPFPPRFLQKDFLAINVLGTVPYMVDGDTHMTESSAMCHYLARRYQKSDFFIAEEHAQYGNFLNWLYHSDATLTFPQTVYLRYAVMEREERRQPQVADDYRKWYLARLRLLDSHILENEFLCDSRFTIADIVIGYALFLGESLGFAGDYSPQVRDYLKRLKQRPALSRSIALTESLDLEKPNLS